MKPLDVAPRGAKPEAQVDESAKRHETAEAEKLRSGDVVKGPAVITEMDSTTLVHTGHIATVDDFGNIMIMPA